MPRSQSTTLSLPPFAGITRRLILLNLGVFFAIAILSWVSRPIVEAVVSHLILEPKALLRGEIWQLATYSLVEQGILGVLFSMLTLWFTGSLLEGSYGGQWVAELYGVSVVGGALVAAAVSFTRVFGLHPASAAFGPWAGIFGLLIAIAMLFGDQEFLLWFVLRLKAKYMVAIYILIAVAILLKQADSFNALLQLAGALSGFLYVRFAPRRGLAFGFTEQIFGMRNGYYRWKRRRAARKFEVYMRKQNREVHFDQDGRYVDPDEVENRTARTEREKMRQQNDRRRMN
ncbi:MAG: rhomboid family intramembrane serine protease [Acidobacteriaceae bacterium]